MKGFHSSVTLSIPLFTFLYKWISGLKSGSGGWLTGEDILDFTLYQFAPSFAHLFRAAEDSGKPRGLERCAIVMA